MSTIDPAILRVFSELREGNVDAALEICRAAMRTLSDGPLRDSVRLHLGFCCLWKLRANMAAGMRDLEIVVLCGDAIDALTTAYEAGVETAPANAVEAALLLGDLCLLMRDHVRHDTPPAAASEQIPGALPAARPADLVRDLRSWCDDRIGDETPQRDRLRGREETRDSLVTAYRCARMLYLLAHRRAASLWEAETTRRGTGGRTSARRHADLPHGGGSAAGWLWCTSMILAEYVTDFGGAEASADSDLHLQEALQHASAVRAGALGQGLWALGHTALSFDAEGCVLLALGRLQAARNRPDEALQKFVEAYERFSAAHDNDGRIAALAARAEVYVRLLEPALGDERERRLAEASVQADALCALLEGIPPASGSLPDVVPATLFARSIDRARHGVSLFMALGRIEELRGRSEMAQRWYLDAYDCLSLSADPREFVAVLLRIGTVYRRMELTHDAEDALRNGLAIAHDLRYRRYEWEFHDALSDLYEARRNFPEALNHARRANVIRAQFHQEQLMESIARRQVALELDRAEQMRRRADEHARRMEEREDQAQREKQQLAAQLGQRAVLIEGIEQAVLRVLRANNASREVLTAVSQAVTAFNSGDSGWRQFDRQIEVQHPDFAAELNERAPGLTKTERRICALMRAGRSADEIVETLKGRAPETEIERASWKNNLARHRFNILDKLRGNDTRSVGAPSRKRASRSGAHSEASGDGKERRQQGMRLDALLQFMGSEPGDAAMFAKLRERCPEIPSADLMLCRQMARGFSDEQIAEFHGTSTRALRAWCRRVELSLGLNAEIELREALKTIQ